MSLNLIGIFEFEKKTLLNLKLSHLKSLALAWVSFCFVSLKIFIAPKKIKISFMFVYY